MILKFKKINLNILNNLNVNQDTIVYYKELTGYFLVFMKQNGYQFKQPVLLKYKEYLKSTTLKSNTKRSYFNAARLFCQLLYSSKLIKADVTKDVLGRRITGFQTGVGHVYGISRTEVAKITRYLSQLPTDFTSDRLRAIIALLLYQGLRQIEIFRLNIEDIDFENGQLTITGKGRDYSEIINLHPKTVQSLAKYCQYLYQSGPLIVNCRNKRERLASPLAIHYIVKSRLNKLNIQRSVHGFRHYFATMLIEHYKGDLAMVSLYTRHRNLNTLQIYNDKILNIQDLENYYAAIDKYY